MKNKDHTLRSFGSVIRSALGLILIGTFVGRASKSGWNGQYRADRNEWLARGCVFYFDGAGCR